MNKTKISKKKEKNTFDRNFKDILNEVFFCLFTKKFCPFYNSSYVMNTQSW